MHVKNAQNDNLIAKSIRAWAYALVPSLTGYKKLLFLIREEAQIRIGLIWTTTTSLIGALIVMTYFVLVRDFGIDPQLPTIRLVVILGFGIVSIIVSAIIQLGLTASVSQFLSKRLGGKGSLSSLIYVYSSFISPINLISTTYYCVVSALIEYTDITVLVYAKYLTIALMVYQVVLSAYASKTVHEFSWKNAAISSIPMLVFVSLYYLTYLLPF